ncbi:MAG: sigma-70 family RNA polymerase sigma factor [Planctomycetota bacterium]|nr:sigma-70 family RNA polymerase sigma factor [Planctomycetota bacterium]
MEKIRTLVPRARKGDLDAYGEIVRRFQDMAYGYAYSILGDFHLAEDAAHEAFIEAYRCLANLCEPTAFPGWFRRIVFKHCDRLTRGREVPTVPLDAAAMVRSNAPGPVEMAEKIEMRNEVLEAIRRLPAHEREATTLFYISGYSQNEIAEFLETPVTTVNNRLAASRNRLKERMLNMVEETLHKNAPDERFSKKVIEELLARPRPLEIEGHPVREAWDEMRAALSDYEVINGPEVEDKQTSKAAEDHAFEDYAYRLGDNKALRFQMTSVTMTAVRGRKPPVRLLAAGRVFRPDKGDATRSKVFHQVDGVCIDVGADVKAFKRTCERAIHAAVPGGTIRWVEHDTSFVVPGFQALASKNHRELDILGGGMLQAKTLEGAGFDPKEVSGFAWGLSLERLAMLKLGIDDIRKLWVPPYVLE